MHAQPTGMHCTLGTDVLGCVPSVQAALGLRLTETRLSDEGCCVLRAPDACRWMENHRDWCISRQLWFGHRIPAYYVTLAGEAAAAPGGPSERMDRWVIAQSAALAQKEADARFPGQQPSLQQVCPRSCPSSSRYS